MSKQRQGNFLWG